MNQNTKVQSHNTGLYLIVIILIAILMVSSSIGLYAWAKYTTSQGGNATADIAKWNFDLKLKNGPKNGSAEETTGPIDLADTIDFVHVKSNTIAPGTNGQFQVIVDTSGTEVDCQYDVTIVLENCPRNITFSKIDEQNNITVLSAGGADNTTSRTLSFSKYLQAKKVDGNTTTNENGKHIETITWDWPFELATGTDEEKVAYDTIDKQDNGLQVLMTITAKGTEVLSRPLSLSTVQYTKGNESSIVNDGDTITLEIEETPQNVPNLSIQQSNTEPVVYTSSNTNIVTVNENGEITTVNNGTTTIIIRGTQTGREVVVNVKVKPKLTLQIGDYIDYTPTGSYNWNMNYAESGYEESQTVVQLTSGTNGTHKITRWRVLNVDNETGAIDMVPANLVYSGTVRLFGAQGYNNGVKLLNDACSSLYSGPQGSGITARSININDVENAIKYGGTEREEALNTAKQSMSSQSTPNGTDTNYYPTMYERETSSVITPTPAIEPGKETNLGQSQQNSFIEENESNAFKKNEKFYGYKKAGTSIQPYRSAFFISWASTTKERLLRGEYWIASRSVWTSGITHFCLFFSKWEGIDTSICLYSTGSITGTSRYLFPVVSLNSKVLSKDGTYDGYNKYVVDLE